MRGGCVCVYKYFNYYSHRALLTIKYNNNNNNNNTNNNKCFRRELIAVINNYFLYKYFDSCHANGQHAKLNPKLFSFYFFYNRKMWANKFERIFLIQIIINSRHCRRRRHIGVKKKQSV